MKQALRHLLSDLLSAILFLVVYAVSGSYLQPPPSLLPPGLRNSPVSD